MFSFWNLSKFMIKMQIIFTNISNKILNKMIFKGPISMK